MKPPRKEVDIGPPVIAWLVEQGHEVYQEVEASYGVADLVGIRGPMVGVVEMKVSLSWDLLYQARRWRGVAHQVWIAVPAGKNGDGRAMAHRTFEREGVGILTVRWAASLDPLVDVTARPAFNRRADVSHVKKWLREEQKTFAAAGSAGGRHWTEFKGTCHRLREYLAAHPGATIREAVAEVKHHYASDAGARSRLVSLIEDGAVEGVRLEREGRVARLYATAEAT